MKKKREIDRILFRIFDLTIAFLGLLIALPVLILLYFVGLIDTGSPLFFQTRVGAGKRPFRLVKFRSMLPSTKSVASHLVSPSAVTTFGRFLRKSKLDELPQLWNVLTGDMSVVGPRPCLFNQEELIREREKLGVFDVKPGITGLAQVDGVDMSTPRPLAELDAKMIAEFGFSSYFKLIVLTIKGRGRGDAVQH